MMLLSDYYKTAHWKKFRLSITDCKDCVCEICGVARWTPYKRKAGYLKPVRFDLHHTHYNSMFKEKRADVLALCTQCHMFCHQSEMMARTRGGVFAANYQNILLDTLWRFTPQERGRKLK